MPKKRTDLNSQPQLISEPQNNYTISPEQLAEKETYRQRLAEFLQDPASRQIEGFPIGEDEDILALSDPPYYTACPNPFLGEIIEKWQQERRDLRKELSLPDDSQENGIHIYHREPFAADVSEGKNDPIYNAHSYHTKVPHKAIMRYILHYTDPGDIVLDGFCGTGMTGVAAQLCGDKKTIESLGYSVQREGAIIDEKGRKISQISTRKSVLVDLSPAATFIAYNYNTPFDVRLFKHEAKAILKEVEKECGWMYETWHPSSDDPNRVKGKINYTIWSDVFICPQCSNEIIYWDVAIDNEHGRVNEVWECPHCGTKLAKRPQKESGAVHVERAWITRMDRALGYSCHMAKRIPVLINYSVGKQRKEKKPDEIDLELIKSIEDNVVPYYYPTSEIPKGDKTGDLLNSGITNVHQIYTSRNSYVLAVLWNKIVRSPCKHTLQYCFTASLRATTKLSTIAFNYYFHGGGGAITRGIKGTYFISSCAPEIPVLKSFADRIPAIERSLLGSLGIDGNNSGISSQSSENLWVAPLNSVDYIFVDPPFGSNLMYSELNIILESWLKTLTNNKVEAIINNSQHKKIQEYQEIMRRCFDQFFRLLKPGHWMTVEFHNSQNSVWNSIQEALLQSGFMVADVRTFNKQQGTYNQLTSTGAVKQDLVISTYKPATSFENQFQTERGTEQGAWMFIRQHLEQLPMPMVENGIVETLIERQAYLLFDRMVAFHIIRGFSIPLSASEFYQGLNQRFLERDGMYFTPAQAAEYDKLRMKADRVEQLALFVTDEKSAVQWLRQSLDPALGGQPQTYQDIQPKFIQQLHQERHEKLPELREILEENFLLDEIERWYSPDPEHQADLEKLRERLLLREFTEYRKSKGKLRIFRSEAVRAGFSQAWRERDYSTILEVSERLPEQVLQEDPALKMYYDNALHRADRQPIQDPLF